MAWVKTKEKYMFYWLTQLSDGGDFFNLFRYITFRAGGAFFTALLFGFLLEDLWLMFFEKNKVKANLLEMMARQRILRKLELLQWEVC